VELLTGGGQTAYQHAPVILKIIMGVVNVLDLNGDYQGRRQNLGSKWTFKKRKNLFKICYKIFLKFKNKFNNNFFSNF
jgi:hypothetical protein